MLNGLNALLHAVEDYGLSIEADEVGDIILRKKEDKCRAESEEV